MGFDTCHPLQEAVMLIWRGLYAVAIWYHAFKAARQQLTQVYDEASMQTLSQHALLMWKLSHRSGNGLSRSPVCDAQHDSTHCPVSRHICCLSYLCRVNICDVDIGRGASGGGGSHRLGWGCRSLGLLGVSHAGEAAQARGLGHELLRALTCPCWVKVGRRRSLG